MSLSSDSNTINALGIFGRLTPELEAYFHSLEEKYSMRPESDPANGIFNHLSLVIKNDVPVGNIPKYLDCLRALRPYLPVRLKTNGVIIKEDKHVALSFDTKQTETIRGVALSFIPGGVVTTFYTKVVWFVPKENLEKVMQEVANINELVFYDFFLVANRQNDENMIYSSNRYQ